MSETPFAVTPTITKTAPFGYLWHDGLLIVYEPEAHARRLMYELFLTHQRKKTVARLLNEAGCRTRSGVLFSDTAVDRLLRDSSALGAVQTIQNGTTKLIGIEPLVTADVWEQINAILNDEQKPLKRSSRLFAGLVFCECGGRMSVPSNSPKYVCANCRRKIETADLEAIFVRQLAEFPLSAFGIAGDGGSDRGGAATLAGLWLDLSPNERRLLVEQLIRRLEVGARRVAIRFSISSASIETAARGQQQLDGATPQLVLENQKPDEKQRKRRTRAEPPPLAPPAGYEPSAMTTPENTPQIITEPLLNETEAARFLGVSRMTLLRKRNAGEIKFFRVGFRVLYSKEQHLSPFLAKCERGTQK